MSNSELKYVGKYMEVDCLTKIYVHISPYFIATICIPNKLHVTIVFFLFRFHVHIFPSSPDKMAGQSDVDQAGDHHGDAEHPSGGQEREGEEVPHHLRGHEAGREPHTGDRTEHLSAGEKPKKNGDNCDACVTFLFMWEICLRSDD